MNILFVLWLMGFVLNVSIVGTVWFLVPHMQPKKMVIVLCLIPYFFLIEAIVAYFNLED